MRVYTVSEYRDELNELLANVTVAIEGEVTSFNVSQNRFVWFSLADENCVIDCFMMNFELKQPIAEGMMIRAVGSPNMFKKGKVVFRPRQVEVLGDGDLQRAFELLQQQLEKEGLFAEGRKRALPKIPVRIGIVTSRDAAAYTDMLRVIGNRWSGVEIVLAHAQVQGAEAAGSIVRNLERLYAYSKDVALDCIVVTRGGGSMEDLQAFNTEEVVRAVYRSPVPIISAIGHERDVTLVDFVADVRAATPSNAAELLVPHTDDVMQAMEYTLSRIRNAVQHSYRDVDQRLSELMASLKYLVLQPIHQSQELIGRLTHELQRMQHDVALKLQKIESLETLLHSVNPQTVLHRGYSITRDEAGAIIRSAQQAQEAKTTYTQFADGIAESSVQRIIRTNQE